MATEERPEGEEFMSAAVEAVEAAIDDLHERGIATTHWVDGRLVRVHPDGRHEDLGALDRS